MGSESLKNKPKVCQLTTVHNCSDTRIFFKQCTSLAANGVDVIYVAPEGKIPDVRGVTHLALPIRKGRLKRIFLSSWDAFKLVIKSDAKVVHFHDPELIPTGILLKLCGKLVVYDVHEDVPAAILDKFWIPVGFRRLIASFVRLIELAGELMFDGIVTATPAIASKFSARKVICIQNFPRLNEISQAAQIPYEKRAPRISYVGWISQSRGILEVIQAIGLVKGVGQEFGFDLIGEFNQPKLKDEVSKDIGWKRVKFLGFQDRECISAVLGEARAGIVTFLSRANHVQAQPNKLFDYMSAGIPVIASDFPLWRKLIEETKCGLLVNPNSSEDIARAIEWVVNHPKEASEMGRRGRAAIEKKYNWDVQECKLMGMYESLGVL